MAFHIRPGKRSCAGFTLIELLAVMTIIGALMSLVAPSFLKSNDRARETVLRHNLQAIRHALDDYRADHGGNPDTLDALISARYLRELPMDPVTGRRDSWMPQRGDEPGVNDVISGAKGKGLDGIDYASW